MFHLHSLSRSDGWLHQTCVTFFLVSSLGLFVCNSEIHHHAEGNRFESLLAAGRPLVFPFSPGYLLSVAAIQETNWNISWKGYENVTGMTLKAANDKYTTLLQDMVKDVNITMKGTIYSLRESWNSSEENFHRLRAEVKKVKWDNANWHNTFALMNADIVKSTSPKFDKQLIPEDNEVGNPFPFSTEAILTSTFRYRNSWELPWTLEERNFGDSGITQFLQAKHEYLVAKEEEFTAVSVPLQGGRKSLIFVLPAVNITRRYFRNRSNNLERQASSKPSSMESDSINHKRSNLRENLPESEIDTVPLPTKWQKRNISLHIPSFNFSHSDNFGEQFVELGLNESFCTTIHDRVGRFPYYLRPLPQINAIEMRQESLEVLSATGTAVQKFFIGLDFLGSGYPKLKSEISKELGQPEGEGFTTTTEKEEKSEDSPLNYSREEVVENNHHHMKSPQSLRSLGEGLSGSDDNGIEDNIIIFDRPFLFYLNDIKSGPLFYGTVEKITNEENTRDEVEGEQERQVKQFILWSCRKFGGFGTISSASSAAAKDEELIKISNES